MFIQTKVETAKKVTAYAENKNLHVNNYFNHAFLVYKFNADVHSKIFLVENETLFLVQRIYT